MNVSGAIYCARCGARLSPPGPQPAHILPTAAPTAPPAAGRSTPSPQPFLPAYGGPGVPYATPPPGYPVYVPVEGASAGPMMTNTFRVLGKDFLSYVFLFLVLNAITVALNVAITYAAFGTFTSGFDYGAGPPDMASLATYVALLPVVAVAGILIGAWFVGAATYLAVRRHRDQPVPLGEALRHAGRRLPSLLGGVLLQSALPLVLLLLPLTLLVVGAAGLVVGGVPDPTALSLIFGACGLFLLLVPLAIFIAVKLALTVPAIVADGKTAVGALRHSWRLMTGFWWNYFLATIVIGLVAFGISVVVAFPTGLAGNTVIAMVGEIVGGALAAPWGIVLSAVAFSLIVREKTLLQPQVPTPYWIPYAGPGTPPSQ